MAKKKAVFDTEEAEILSAFESGGMVSVEDAEAEKAKAIIAAKNTKAKTKQVSIRLPVKDLIAIQKKAEDVGLPYQTLINLLIHQYSQNKINLVL